MSALKSFLSSADYGYDYVLAVTQDSINATALAFLATKQPVINVCYIYDDNGDPQQIAYQTLKEKAQGADPFNVPQSDPERDAALKKLDEAGFMFGFSAAMGVPEGFAADQVPDIVTLGAAAEDHSIYRLLCRNFQLVELKPIPHKKPVFQTFSQPKGPSGQPWVFSYGIKLVLQPPEDAKAFLKTSAFGNLPSAIQSKLKEKPEDFTIRQLLFEFAKAVGKSEPEISGVDRVLKEKLHEDFSIRYFAEMAAAGAPILAVTPSAKDPFANLKTEFSINPSPDQPKLATLNYLCATGDHALPAPKPFAWNWVDPNEVDKFDGACVINRSQLVQHFETQLAPYVKSNSWLPHPVEVFVRLTDYFAAFGIVDRDNSVWPHAKFPEELKIEKETLEKPKTGSVLLDWQFHTTRECDYLSGTSWMRGETTFTLKVSCSGNTITIEQHAMVWCKLVMVTFSRHDWRLVDQTITDVFTLAAEHDGKLTARRESNTVDASEEVGSDLAVPDLKQRFDAIKSKANQQIASRLVDIPLSLLGAVIFPGGKEFIFKDVAFSEHQDLVARITYADPS